jgi:ATP-dependent protease ClpP protease subunit
MNSIPSNSDNDLYNIHTFSINPKDREIFLHSYIECSEEESGLDHRVAVTFEKNLRYLNSISTDPILIHMHLPGGVWSDCLGMYDAIKFSKAKTILLAYGSVESASSVILQAPDTRILMPNTTVLIHYGSISVENDHKAAMSSIEWSEKESQKMIDIFADKCMSGEVAKEKNWKKLMARKHIVSQLANKCDWIITAEEAVYYGFADGVLGSKRFPSIESIKARFCKSKKS